MALSDIIARIHPTGMIANIKKRAMAQPVPPSAPNLTGVPSSGTKDPMGRPDFGASADAQARRQRHEIINGKGVPFGMSQEQANQMRAPPIVPPASSAAEDLSLADTSGLTPEELSVRKKKLMSAGDDSAASLLFPSM